MGMCDGKESWAEVTWGFLDERMSSMSRATVQCQGFWETVRVWGQERIAGVQGSRDPGSLPWGFRQCRKQSCFTMYPGFRFYLGIAEANGSGDDAMRKIRDYPEFLRGRGTQRSTRVSRGQREQGQRAKPLL